MKHIVWLWAISTKVCGEENGVVLITRRIRFLFKALVAYRSVKPFIDASQNSPLGKLMLSRSQTIGAVIWPYQCAAWNAPMRLARIREHYEVIEKIGGEIDFPVNGQVSLLNLSNIREGLHMILDQPEWFMREGQLSINLFLDDVRMYVLAFSFFHKGNSVAACIGAIQGRDIDGALDRYRELTKASNGMRPRDLLVELFRYFCEGYGVTEIFAVSDAYRHHRDPYFGPAAIKKFTTNYDEVWKDRGGVQVSPMFYQLAVLERERDLTTIPAKKRGLYRRRYEMLRRIRMQMRDRCNSLR